MPKALKINKASEEGIKDFFEFLLGTEKVRGIFTLKRMNEHGAVSYSLLTSVDEIKNACPLFPLMPVNAGKILSGFTLKESLKEPMAAVLRPCELRAFVELIKRAQGNLDNFLLISMTCGGVLTFNLLTNGNLNKQLPSYWESAKKAEIASGLRPTCTACEYFIPEQADMIIATAAKKEIDHECHIFLNTKKGEDFAKDAPGEFVSEEVETEQTKKLLTARQEHKKKIYEEVEQNNAGLKSLVKTFAPCLNCHACSHACPICYCTLCDFESKIIEYSPASYDIELNGKGAMRIPPGTLFFHTGRMIHMAVSCVGCGMCSDVCPVNIPVASIFSKVGDSLQKLFDYLPGKDVEQPLPFGTFKTEEFAEIGE